MRIIFAGNNKRSEICLKYLFGKNNIEIVLVICHLDQKTDQGYYRSVKPIAEKLNLPSISPSNINSPECKKIISSLQADLMILVGYSASLLKKETFSLPRNGTINLHASPLPYYRGAAPLNWMLINGETKGSISIIEIDEGIDTGPILAKEDFEITNRETIISLTEKVNKLYPRLLYDTILKIKNNTLVKMEQSISRGSFFSKRYPDDGYINFSQMKAVDVDRIVRALKPPYPGAFFHYFGEKIIIVESSLESIDYFGIPGRIVKKDYEGIVIIAKDRGIRIRKIVNEEQAVLNTFEYKFRVGTDVNG